MMATNEKEIDTMNKVTLNWIKAVYKLIAELTPDKETFLKALKRLDELEKEVNASGEDER